jgi:transketolase
LRLTRQKLPAVYAENEKFDFGKAKVLKRGEQVALIASGGTVGETLKAAETLAALKPWVVDFHTIKPIDTETIAMLAKSCKAIITIEDHNIIGGLGSAVAESLVECGFSGKMHRIGVGEEYGVSGTPAGLYELFGLSAQKLVPRIKHLLG